MTGQPIDPASGGAAPIHPMYLDGTYAEEHQSYHVEDSPWKAEHVAALLERHGSAPRRVIEVGCGAGAVLTSLAQRLEAVEAFVGFEVSPDAYALARQREAARVSFVFADLLDTDERADVVLCLDVFEHVEDYFGFLRALRSHGEQFVFHIPLDLSVQRLLRPASLMGMRSRMGHLHYFSQESALATLEETGFEVLDVRWTAISVDRPTTVLSRLARLPRLAVARVSIPFAARLFGGWSLMVLAQPSEAVTR